jgi:hypothetical protein
VKASTPRRQIREWWFIQLSSEESVDIKDIADRGFEEFIQDDAFCRSFLQDALRATLYEIGISINSQGKRGSRVKSTRYSASEAADIIEAGTDTTRFTNWLEYDPTSGKHITLMALTREQALAAAEARERRVEPDMRRAGLLRLAAGRLDAGQRIQDVWTVQQIAEIETQLVVPRPTYSLGKGTIYELMLEGAA